MKRPDTNFPRCTNEGGRINDAVFIEIRDGIMLNKKLFLCAENKSSSLGKSISSR